MPPTIEELRGAIAELKAKGCQGPHYYCSKFGTRTQITNAAGELLPQLAPDIKEALWVTVQAK